MCDPRYQRSWGQHGAHLGPAGPRWPHVGPMNLAISGTLWPLASTGTAQGLSGESMGHVLRGCYIFTTVQRISQVSHVVENGFTCIITKTYVCRLSIMMSTEIFVYCLFVKQYNWWTTKQCSGFVYHQGIELARGETERERERERERAYTCVEEKFRFQFIKYNVSRPRLYKMRVLKYYVENKAQLKTWK